MTKRTVAKQPIVDDDDVSINSTETEVYSETDEFVVERIVAEKVAGNGKKMYLISWLGYPERKSTWEPRKHIQDPEIISKWKERKLREERKIEVPYNVARFEAMLLRLASEKETRRRKRKAKRKRLGIAVSPSETSIKQPKDSESSVEAVEVDEKPEDYSGMKRTKTSKSPAKKSKKPIKAVVRVQPLVDISDEEDDNVKTLRNKKDTRVSSESAAFALDKGLGKEEIRPNPYLGTTRSASANFPEEPKHARAASDSSSDTPIANKRPRPDIIQRQASAPSAVPLAKSHQQVTFAPEPPSMTAKSAKPTTAPRKDLLKLGQSTTAREALSTRGGLSSRGRGATRGSSSLRPKKPRNLLTTSSDPKNAPKIFSNMRLQRKALLQSRALADAAPDLAAIGGLFDPSRPSTYQALKPADVRKSRTQDGDSDMGLFVDSDEAAEPESQPRKTTFLGAFKAPPYQALSKGPPPDPSRATCFFWHRGQVDPSKGDCGKKDKCEFIHGYERDVPIAKPPEGYKENNDEELRSSIDMGHQDSTTPPWRSDKSATRLVCFFWDRGQRVPNNPGCAKIDCGYLHQYEASADVAPPPPGFKEDSANLSKAELQDSVQLDDPWNSTEVSRRGSIMKEKAATFDTLISQQNVDPYRATCYYWDRGQKNPDMGSCYRGDSCKFIHAYEEGVRIAFPPENEHATCYYWNLNLKKNGVGSCTRGDSCKYLHYYGDGIPVAPAPLTDSRADRSLQSNEAQHQTDSRTTKNSHSPLSSAPYDGSKSIHAICYEWLHNGSCPTRQSCQFLHTNAPSIPCAPEPEPRLPSESELMGRSRAVASDTYFAPKTVEERHSELSLLSESERQRRARAVPERTMASNIPPMHRKTDRYWSTCYYWDQSGECKMGSRCTFLHAYEDDASIAPSPHAPREKRVRDPRDTRDKRMVTCKHWEGGDCHRTAEECEYLHGYPPGSNAVESKTNGPDDLLSSLIQPDPPRKSVSFAIDETEGSLRQNEDPRGSRNTMDQGICVYYLKGYCRYGTDCRQKHEPGNGGHTVPTTPSQNQRENQRKVSFAPISPSTPIVDRPVEVGCQDHLPIIGSPIESPIEQPPSESPISPQIDSASQVPKAKRAKISYEDYRRKTMLRALGTRAKEVIFGSGEAQPVFVDFGDLASVQEQPWAQQISTLSKFRFDQMCLAQDLATQFSVLLQEGLWQGNLVLADPTDGTASKIVEKVVDELRTRSSGLIAVSPDFVILVYPKTPEWEFVEASNDGQKDVRLRFFILRSNLDLRRPMKIRANSQGIVEPAPHRKTLVKSIYGLRFKDMLPTYKKDKQNPRNFFLLFPSTAYETSNFLTSWLHSSCKGGKVYSSQDEGSWDFFLHSPHSESGVVFIHESVAPDVYRFPSFQDIVKKNIVFWLISDSSPPYPMYPSIYDNWDDVKIGQITATRLLPHGHAFFLTPSFVIAEPKRACELLEWFFGRPKQVATHNTPEIGRKIGKFEGSTAGTWKLVACHKLADYVLDLANSKVAEKKAFETENEDKPSKDQMLEDKGLDYSTCKLRYTVHAKLVEVESRLNTSSDEYDSDFLDEQYSPIIYADRSIDPDNEASLVEWFAAWSLRKLDMYRKFTVVGTGTKSTKRAIRMKEIRNVEEPPLASSKSFSISKKQTQASADRPPPSESPTSPRQKALAVAAKLSAHPKSSLSSSRTVERKSYNDVTSLSSQSRDSPKPPISSPTNHGIDHSHPNVQKFIAITGASASEARDFLSQADNDVKKAVDLYQSHDPMDVEAQVLELIASSKPESSTLPRLATADADTAHAKEIYESPALSAPLSAITSHFPTTEQSSSLQLERTSDPCFTGQFDRPADERPVSSASDSSRSGINVDENGHRFVPRSTDPSASARKEIPVKPGYVSPEVRDFYRNRRVVNGVPQFEVEGLSNNGSKIASPIAPQPMDIDSVPMSKSTSMTGSEKEGTWKESGFKMKEVKFEPTTVWYQRLKESGGGYEHVYIESWEKAFSNLGVYGVKK